jgi:hypothetical protein
MPVAKVVNLNRFRKRKQREQAAVVAAANRVRFGRTKEQRAADSASTEAERERLDALRREPPSPQDTPDPPDND